MNGPIYADVDIRTLLDQCDDGYLITDMDGIVTYANEPAGKLLDVRYDELVGNPLPFAVAHGEESELLLSKRSGEQSVIEIDEKSYRFDGNIVSLWSLRDITEKKYRLAARMIEELTRQQNEKWQSLGSLAGGIAHQFNNVLMIILGQCSALRRGLTHDQPKLDRIEYIENSSLRAIEITNHLLAFAGLGKYEFRALNVSRTITDIKYIFETLTIGKAKMEYNLDPDIPMVWGDDSQLQRMLYEIITNAVEAVGRHKGVINITTGVSSKVKPGNSNEMAEGEYVYIQITDNGCGMDEMTRNRMFNPLFTTKSTAKGLGLSAALGIARTHKGTISVHTIPDFGTTIEIFLPVMNDALVNEADDLIKAAETIISGVDNGFKVPRGTGGRILIAEDEEYMRDLLQEALETGGYQVETAVDGRDCVDKYENSPRPFDCIILDMMMPNLDGEETFQELKRRGSTTPVVLTSGFTRQATITGLKKAGVTFLQKPYKLNDLMTLVAGILKPEEQAVK